MLLAGNYDSPRYGSPAGRFSSSAARTRVLDEIDNLIDRSNRLLRRSPQRRAEVLAEPQRCDAPPARQALPGSEVSHLLPLRH